ncbi:PqqD family peptide modification chaperone [uncultured Leifsonia sp.]|uniref:PqqD family peptide modification chaperone n=1 Tax=uncultured Leifsonia sp. TaxID=340359 RepID=UPI0025F54825|nr:PqqD family peptide modification chaperone [uncultured Leifsonia sp.]
MTHDFVVDALGVGLRVEVDGMSRDDFRRLRAQWSRVSAPRSRVAAPRSRVTAQRAPSGTISAVLGEPAHGADVSGRDFDEVSVALRQMINLRAIESRREELLMFHAAGLADPTTGHVIALIGPSGAGKTTAASTLGRVLGYVSDETVAVDASGEVHPFPKPLAVKQRNTPRKSIAGPDALGLVDVRAPLQLTRLALLDRREEPVAPAITTLGMGEVLAQVIEQTSYFASLPRALRRLEARIRISGGVHVIRYHRAADLHDPVCELLRRPAAHLAQEEGPAVRDVEAVAGALPPGAYGRQEVDDWIDTGREVLILVGGKTSRLSPLGSVLWNALETPLPLDDLVARAEAVFGPAPEDAARITVQSMLDEFVAAGFVRRNGKDAQGGSAENDTEGDGLPSDVASLSS